MIHYATLSLFATFVAVGHMGLVGDAMERLSDRLTCSLQSDRASPDACAERLASPPQAIKHGAVLQPHLDIFAK